MEEKKVKKAKEMEEKKEAKAKEIEEKKVKKAKEMEEKKVKKVKEVKEKPIMQSLIISAEENTVLGNSTIINETCNEIIKSGTNKGSSCGQKCFNTGLCKRHYNLTQNKA